MNRWAIVGRPLRGRSGHLRTLVRSRVRADHLNRCILKPQIDPSVSDSLPLAGRTVVITRARTQADEFVKELEQFGANVIVCPTIEICPLENYERLDEAISHLYGYDWLIFTSVNGVDYFFQRLHANGHQTSELDDVKVCAIGESTSERLRDLHVHVDVIPDESKAEGVYAALEAFIGGRDAMAGLNVLIPRAAVARDFLPRTLQEAGARVDIVPAYRTSLPVDLDRGRIAAMLSGDADCIAFTSASTIKNLGKLFDTPDLSEALAGIAIACIGDITAATAVDFGLTVDIQPSESTTSALTRAIANYFAQLSQA